MAAQNDTASPNGTTEAAVVPPEGNEAVELVLVSNDKGEPSKVRKVSVILDEAHQVRV
jgi:hypothetical protein